MIASFAKLGTARRTFAPVIMCNDKYTQSTVVIGPASVTEKSSQFRAKCLAECDVPLDHFAFRIFPFGDFDVIGLLSRSPYKEPSSERTGFPIFWGAAISGLSGRDIAIHGANILDIVETLVGHVLPQSEYRNLAERVQYFLSLTDARRDPKIFRSMEERLDRYADLFSIREMGLLKRLQLFLSDLDRSPPAGDSERFLKYANSKDRDLYDWFLKIWCGEGRSSDCTIWYAPTHVHDRQVVITLDRSTIGKIKAIEDEIGYLQRSSAAKPTQQAPQIQIEHQEEPQEKPAREETEALPNIET